MIMKRTIMIFAALATLSLGAYAQKVKVKNNVIYCGNVAYEQPVTVKFELENTGSSPIVINNVRTSCGCTTVEYPKQAIPAGDHFVVNATYDARMMGHFSKDVGLYTNNSEKPIYLTMRGVVVDEVVDFDANYDFTIGSLKTDADNVEFDDVNRGEMPVKKIHIMNTSNKTLSPTVMHLPNYLKASVSPTNIAAGRTGVVTLMLDSKHIRDYGLTQTTLYLGMFPGDKVASEKELPVSVVLLPAFTELTESEMANAPQISLSSETVDIDFNGKSKKSETILINNIGHSELDISSLQMFTNGLSVKLNKSKLQPGEQAKLKITAEAKALRRVRTKPRVLMISNDPMKSKIVININVK